MPVPIIAAAGVAAGGATINSARTDGGIVNTLLKVAVVVAIFGFVIVAYMWVSGNFSLEAIVDSVANWYMTKVENFVMRYTPVGWAISATSGVISLFTGKVPTISRGQWRNWVARKF
mgnify:CR=1 FL=1